MSAAILTARSRRATLTAPLRLNRTLTAGLVLLTLIVLAAVCAPLLTSWDPIQQDLTKSLLPPGDGHLLGTDQLGRDVFARLLYGARVDLRVGALAVLFPFLIGTTLGLLAGWFGGWFDLVLMRVVDMVVAFPFFVLVIALVFALGSGTSSIYIAITLVGWVAYARIVRGEVLVAKEQEYALAARASGLPTWRILLRHLLPNVMLQAFVFAMSDVVLCILAIVTLGYLGLGVPPPTPDWGSMIQEGQAFILTKWYLAAVPGLAVVVTGLSLALIADGFVQRSGR
ncbi:peptide/nickel transport system permease protein [Friedmanniella luteola]|uniref:Peptide/nickel transport system permease protein n=1 Tax=Friedmanniella luteola TaxID=546871 RepID=A0A1H1ZH91_9ACTN|nr:ABC transporter permease [Friedmanniella luteola]SDT33009.1 peptide/nickel transport system permease protein [Friedmanniella luteola]